MQKPSSRRHLVVRKERGLSKKILLEYEEYTLTKKIGNKGRGGGEPFPGSLPRVALVLESSFKWIKTRLVNRH